MGNIEHNQKIHTTLLRRLSLTGRGRWLSGSVPLLHKDTSCNVQGRVYLKQLSNVEISGETMNVRLDENNTGVVEMLIPTPWDKSCQWG